MKIIYVHDTVRPNNYNLKIVVRKNDTGYLVTSDNIILMDKSLNDTMKLPCIVDVQRIEEPIAGTYVTFEYFEVASLIDEKDLQNIIRCSDMNLFPIGITKDFGTASSEIVAVYDRLHDKRLLAVKPSCVDAMFVVDGDYINKMPDCINCSSEILTDRYGDLLADTIIDVLMEPSLFQLNLLVMDSNVSQWLDLSDVKSLYSCNTFTAISRADVDESIQYVLILTSWVGDGSAGRIWLYDSMSIKSCIPYIRNTVIKIFDKFKKES